MSLSLTFRTFLLVASKIISDVIEPCLRIIGFSPLQSTTVDSMPISQDP